MNYLCLLLYYTNYLWLLQMELVMAEKSNAPKVYKWDEASIIPRVDVRTQNNNAVAYIYAADNADEHSLSELRSQFKNKGWATSSDTRGGKSVLRVSGLNNADELISILTFGRYVNGDARSTSEETTKPPETISQKLKANSLRASGIFYTIGNSLYIASGFARGKDIHQIGTGVAFSAGDVLLTVFGGKDDQRQFTSLLTKYKNHLEKQGVEIPKDSALYAETDTRRDTPLDKSYNFIHEHINKIKASAEVVGGWQYWLAGRDQGNKWKQITSIIFSLGFGSSIFIPEKKPDPEKLKNADLTEKAWSFVQESPLRIAGWSGLSNTILTTYGAFMEKAKYPGKNFYKYDLATASSMLVGNNLYALSNKTTGGSITEEGLISDIYGIAAQVLNRLPEEKRPAAIKATVDFLGERVEIKDSREQIDKLLREKMLQSSKANPWFKAKTDELHLSPETTQETKTPAWKDLLIPPARTEDKWKDIASRPSELGLSPA